MREQDPAERARNFEEVTCGYDEAEAMRESERCLICPEPDCIGGCPVGIDIPGFIERIAEKDLHGAYDVLGAHQPAAGDLRARVPAGNPVRGRVHGRRDAGAGGDRPAGALRRRPRHRRGLGQRRPHIEPTRFRVGIVGSGPAGMACAADMAKAGCEVTVYEAFHLPGGVLRYGIPDFRLPNTVVDAEIDKLRRLGVKFECNTLVGRLFTIEQMIDEWATTPCSSAPAPAIRRCWAFPAIR